MIEEEKLRRIDSFMADVANPAFKVERDVTITNNHTGERLKVAIAVRRGTTERGITYDTYEKHREIIDKKFAEAMAKRSVSFTSNSFVIRALTGQFQTLLINRQIPLELFKRLQNAGHVRYYSAQDREDFDVFDKPAGWEITDSGKEAIVAYALKVATAEEKAFAEKINREQQERDEQHRLKAERLGQARFLASEIPNGELFTLKQGEQRYHPVGEEIMDPRNPRTPYGGGQWWVIEQDRILSIYNNGHDGDDWSANTIATGEAGAYAFILPKTEELVNKLHKIKGLSE